jgi:membrane protein implicated in regulation of membrane protease activity
MGAIAVGIVALIIPATPVWLQVLLWAGASVAFTLMWFKYLKPRGERTKSGQSKEAIVGESGMIIRGTADSYEKGTVKFRMSILGADEWTCYADEPLAVGDNVRVIDIEGQVLKVTKL